MKAPPVAKVLRFKYLNYRNEESVRIIRPMVMSFVSLKPWYPTPTWLIRGYDYAKNDYRDFRLIKMSNIEEIDWS